MSPYVAFDNNPVFWADPSGSDSWMYDWDSHNRGDEGYYVNTTTGEKTKDWQVAVYGTLDETNSSFLISVDFIALGNELDKEFGIGYSSSKGEAIVKTYMKNLALTSYVLALRDATGDYDSWSIYRDNKPIAKIPEFAVRKREVSKGRNWLQSMRQNRDYGSIIFNSDFTVQDIIDFVASGDYGYMYTAGSNVEYNTLGNEQHSGQGFMDNTFAKYHSITFSDTEGKHVGGLFFRTKKIFQDFVKYFEVTLRAKYRDEICQKIKQ